MLMVVNDTALRAAYADEEDTGYRPHQLPSGRHRIDFGWSRLANSRVERNVLLPGYTYAFRGDMRVGVNAALVDSSFDSTGSAGNKVSNGEFAMGDTELSFQYDPSGRLTASPWIPDSAGLAAGLLIPTGDARKALGGNAWIARLGLGWTIDFPSSFWLVPSLTYERSFNGRERAETLSQLEFGLGFYWIFPFGAWFGFEPSVNRDFDQHQWGNDHTFIVGWTPRRGPGLSLQYGNPEPRLEQLAGRDKDIFLLNVFYQLGETP